MDVFVGWIVELAADWREFVARALTEGSIAFCVVVAIWFAVRRAIPARLGYVIFGLVLLKLTFPLEVAAPSWLAWLAPSAWFAEPVAPLPVQVGWLEPPASMAAPAATMTSDAWLFLAWLGVVSVLLGRFLLQQRRMTAILRAAAPLGRDALAGLDRRELQRTAGVRTPIRWLVTDRIDSPATGGIRRPYILLPHGFAQSLDARALRWVLLHELAHVRRRDVAAACFQRLAQIALFFHPLVWWTNRLIDEQREFACDDAAFAASGSSRRDCGEGFLSVVAWARSRGSRSAAPAMAMFDEKSAIRRRLMRIIHEPKRGSRLLTFVSGTLALAMAAVLLPSTQAAAAQAMQKVDQDPKRESQARELRELERRLAKLRREQAALERELEAYYAKRGGRARWRVVETPGPDGGVVRFRGAAPRVSAAGEVDAPLVVTDPRGKGIVVDLEDVTIPEIAVAGAEEEFAVVISERHVGVAPEGSGRVAVRVGEAPTSGTFVELVEEIEEEFADETDVEFGEAEIVFDSVEVVDEPAEPTSTHRARIRSGDKTHVIELHDLREGGVIEVDGQTFRLHRTRGDAKSAGPRGPKQPPKARRPAPAAPDAVSPDAVSPEPAKPVTTPKRVRRVVAPRHKK